MLEFSFGEEVGKMAVGWALLYKSKRQGTSITMTMLYHIITVLPVSQYYTQVTQCHSGDNSIAVVKTVSKYYSITL